MTKTKYILMFIKGCFLLGFSREYVLLNGTRGTYHIVKEKIGIARLVEHGVYLNYLSRVFWVGFFFFFFFGWLVGCPSNLLHRIVE